MKRYVNVIFTLFDWSYDPRKHLIKEVFEETKDWADSLVIQHPVGLIGHFFTRFKQKIIGLVTGKYRTRALNDSTVLFTPIILFHYGLWNKNNIFSKIDIFLFKFQVNHQLAKKYKQCKIILWLHMPKMFHIIDKIKHDYLVYDYQDNFGVSHISDEIDTEIALDALYNKKIVEESDLVICTAKVMYEYAKQLNSNTIRMPNGNDFRLLSNKNLENLETEITHLAKPVIGYVGAFKDWLDFELLKYVVSNMKDVYFVFIGHIGWNANKFLNELKQNGNVIHLEYIDQEVLGAYMRKFDVGILPFRLNKFMEGVFPNKFFEYMAVEIPIVSTALLEIAPYSDLIGYSQSKEEFLDNCKRALRKEFDKQVSGYSEIAKENSWQNRAIELNFKLKETFHVD